MSKNKKTRIILFIGIGIAIFIAVILFTGNKKEEILTETIPFPVEVKAVKKCQRSKQVEYFGIVSSSVMNYSFVMSGKVETIFVNKNQIVTKGTKLIQLETSGLKLALEASEKQFVITSYSIHYTKLYDSLPSGLSSRGRYLFAM